MLHHHRLREDAYALCAQEPKTIQHLMIGCVHNQETWYHVLGRVNLVHLALSRESPLAEWWALGSWMQKGLWKERTCRFFDRLALPCGPNKQHYGGC
jgi:hypothetical protein